MDMLGWWGFQGVLQKWCEDFLLAWNGFMKIRCCRKLWALIGGCVIWLLWYERNKVKFEMRPPALHIFIYNLKLRVGLWARELLGYGAVQPHVFIDNIEAVYQWSS